MLPIHTEPGKSNFMYVFYGLPGVGKTTLAQTFDTPLILDFEGSISRAEYNTPHLRINNWQEMEQYMQPEHTAEFQRFKTIVVDTLGSALEQISLLILQTSTKGRTTSGLSLSLPGYGELGGVWKKFQRWCQRLGLDLVILCHVQEQTDNREQIFYRPATIGKASLNDVINTADLMALLEIDEARGRERVLRFSPSKLYLSKDSAKFGDIPFDLSEDFGKSLQDNYREFLERKKSAKKAAQAPKKAVETPKKAKPTKATPPPVEEPEADGMEDNAALELSFKEHFAQLIEKTTDPDDFSEILRDMTEESNRMTAEGTPVPTPDKAFVKALLRERLEHLGLTYNAKEGKFQKVRKNV